MSEKITLCGDNCIFCPRYNAKTEADLQKVAELWYRVRLACCVVSNEEIKCTGCSSHKKKPLLIIHKILCYKKTYKQLRIYKKGNRINVKEK